MAAGADAERLQRELLVSLLTKETKKEDKNYHVAKPDSVPEDKFLAPADFETLEHSRLFATDAVGQCGYPYALDLTAVFDPVYLHALANPEPAVQEKAATYRYALSTSAFQELLSLGLNSLNVAAKRLPAIVGTFNPTLDTLVPPPEPLPPDATEAQKAAHLQREKSRLGLKETIQQLGVELAGISEGLERALNSAKGIATLHGYNKELLRTSLAPRHLAPQTVKATVRAGEAFSGGFTSTHPLLKEQLEKGQRQFVELAQKAAVRAASQAVNESDSDDVSVDQPKRKRRRGNKKVK